MLMLPNIFPEDVDELNGWGRLGRPPKCGVSASAVIAALSGRSSYHSSLITLLAASPSARSQGTQPPWADALQRVPRLATGAARACGAFNHPTLAGAAVYIRVCWHCRQIRVTRAEDAVTHTYKRKRRQNNLNKMSRLRQPAGTRLA